MNSQRSQRSYKSTNNNTNNNKSNNHNKPYNQQKTTHRRTPISHHQQQQQQQQQRYPRALNFVPEGNSDIKTQHFKEQTLQRRYETERLQRNRKSLQDQLRSNAIAKQREFKKLVRKKERFNRISKAEMEFFRRVKRDEIDKEREIERYLDRKAGEFEVRSREVQHSLESSGVEMGVNKSGNGNSDGNVINSGNSDAGDTTISGLPVIVRPKKKAKRVVVVKRWSSPS